MSKLDNLPSASSLIIVLIQNATQLAANHALKDFICLKMRLAAYAVTCSSIALPVTQLRYAPPVKTSAMQLNLS